MVGFLASTQRLTTLEGCKGYSEGIFNPVWELLFEAILVSLALPVNLHNSLRRIVCDNTEKLISEKLAEIEVSIGERETALKEDCKRMRKEEYLEENGDNEYSHLINADVLIFCEDGKIN